MKHRMQKMKVTTSGKFYSPLLKVLNLLGKDCIYHLFSLWFFSLSPPYHLSTFSSWYYCVLWVDIWFSILLNHRHGHIKHFTASGTKRTAALIPPLFFWSCCHRGSLGVSRVVQKKKPFSPWELIKEVAGNS